MPAPFLQRNSPLSEQSHRKRDTWVPFPFCLRRHKSMFHTLSENDCGQGEDSGFTGPMTKHERENNSRASGILLVPLPAPRIVSAFYLKTVSCKHELRRHNGAVSSPSDNWEYTGHALQKRMKCTYFFLNKK